MAAFSKTLFNRNGFLSDYLLDLFQSKDEGAFEKTSLSEEIDLTTSSEVETEIETTVFESSEESQEQSEKVLILESISEEKQAA